MAIVPNMSKTLENLLLLCHKCEEEKKVVYGFSSANMEILIMQRLWGESIAATSRGVRK